MQKGGTVYILSNDRRTTLYIGVTSDLYTRITQHRKQKVGSFTTTYKCFDLIYFENFGSIEEAITREKQLKNWHRKWKDNLIREFNPNLVDLFPQIERW